MSYSVALSIAGYSSTRQKLRVRRDHSSSSELSSDRSGPSSGRADTIAAQQKNSRSFRSRQLPSEFHFKSTIRKFGKGMFTQQAPDGVHMYR
jgi:hypothetical protein